MILELIKWVPNLQNETQGWFSEAGGQKRLKTVHMVYGWPLIMFSLHKQWIIKNKGKN